MALRDEKSRSTCGKDFIVEGEEVCVRENINVVNQNRLIVGEEACSLLESTTRLEELVGFIAETDVDAETVVGLDEINDLLSEMMNIDDNLCDTNTLQFLDKYLHERFATDGHHRLGHGVGKGFETSAETGCENQCIHYFSDER